MLELILTRPDERRTRSGRRRGCAFLVLDELHTYRGRQGADVALLVRRVREACERRRPAVRRHLGHAGRTGARSPSSEPRSRRVATRCSARRSSPEHVIGETLRRATVDDRPETMPARAARARRAAPAAPDRSDELRRRPAGALDRDAPSASTERARQRPAGPRRAPRDDWTARAATLAEADRASTRSCCAEAIQHARCWPASERRAPGHRPAGVRLPAAPVLQSEGDTVYASARAEADRYITTSEQQFVPGDRTQVLLPLAFCRECGQEYSRASHASRRRGRPYASAARDSERHAAATATHGYLYVVRRSAVAGPTERDRWPRCPTTGSRPTTR